MKHFALMSLAALALTAAGCVTTTTGGAGNEKWEKGERAALHTRLGVNYLQQGQVEIAREELDLALRIEPNSSAANLAMAKLELQLGNAREANTHFARAVRYDRDNVAAKNDYGFFLCAQQDFEAGLEQFTAALNHPLNRTQYVSLYGAGECERQAGDTGQAEAFFEQVIALQPDMRQALLRLARINFDRGEHLSARAFLERFFQDGLYTPDSLFLAVQNELKLERRDIASEYARLLRERFPRSSRIDELQGLFRDVTG